MLITTVLIIVMIRRGKERGKTRQKQAGWSESVDRCPVCPPAVTGECFAQINWKLSVTVCCVGA